MVRHITGVPLPAMRQCDEAVRRGSATRQCDAAVRRGSTMRQYNKRPNKQCKKPRTKQCLVY